MSKVKINKSKEIRSFKLANPTASPMEIAAKLKSTGVVVSAQFVSTVLSNAKKKKGGKIGPKPLKVNKSTLSDVVKALRALNDLRVAADQIGLTPEQLIDATK